MNNFKIEFVISLVLIVLTVFLLNPFHFWMPTMLHMVVMALTLVIFALFAVFILREKVRDEREVSNRMFSGRVAFLTGSAVLTVGILIQSLKHVVDIWLVIALVVMVLSKLVSGIYSDRNL